jgi:hypothetical protein
MAAHFIVNNRTVALIFGFRCEKYPVPLPGKLFGPVVNPSRDYKKEKPIGDEAFRVYQSLYAYDRSPLNARVEAVDKSHPDWIREKISSSRFADGPGDIPECAILGQSVP